MRFVEVKLEANHCIFDKRLESTIESANPWATLAFKVDGRERRKTSLTKFSATNIGAFAFAASIPRKKQPQKHTLASTFTNPFRKNNSTRLLLKIIETN